MSRKSNHNVRSRSGRAVGTPGCRYAVGMLESVALVLGLTVLGYLILRSIEQERPQYFLAASLLYGLYMVVILVVLGVMAAGQGR